ncbi:MAG: tRNA (adenosine(37)-N6)-threonylcarbamoyltransferase complex dimerization subunit type 1 TsaB [Elusimicrobia bacterium RIFOXYA2_FULL_39_19]|nr:MAG: tRNA (adenosine(37)-N6)-threonylcarbamoyltransferase complex dimerization subunit type 1 TsaB [Elusimicrobia bacterium RIFOXYA2_FULL_39_19]
MIFSIDTSSKSFSLALAKENVEIVKEIFINEDHWHSHMLITQVELMFKNTPVEKITKIACTTGPGSFTGIRVGLCFARTMAQIHKIPMAGISTLDVLAQQNDNKNPHATICPIINAQQENIYLSTYKHEKGKTLQTSGYSIININTLNKYLDTIKVNKKNLIFCLHTETIKHKDLILKQFPDGLIITDEKTTLPRASTLALLSTYYKGSSYQKVKPLYIQPPRIHQTPKK